MRSYEDLFEKLKCVRCGSRERLVPHLISKVVDSQVVSRRRRSTTYRNTTSTVKLPICSSCNLEFQRWRKSAGKNRWSYCGAGCYTVIMVLVILLGFMNGPDSSGSNPFFLIAPVLLIPIAICLTHAIIISRKSSKMENNPKHSMKFEGREVYVRPMNSLAWISYPDWVNKTLRDSVTEDIERDFKSLSSTGDRKPEFTFCPKCNTKLDKKNKFCKECGEPIN